jgi:hypothetical protein
MTVAWGGEGHQLAQGADRLQLLEGGDGHVRGDDDADEEAVAELTDEEEGEDECAEDDVEEGERVSANDVRVRALTAGIDIGEAGIGAAVRLSGGQAVELGGQRLGGCHGNRVRERAAGGQCAGVDSA